MNKEKEKNLSVNVDGASVGSTSIISHISNLSQTLADAFAIAKKTHKNATKSVKSIEDKVDNLQKAVNAQVKVIAVCNGKMKLYQEEEKMPQTTPKRMKKLQKLISSMKVRLVTEDAELVNLQSDLLHYQGKLQKMEDVIKDVRADVKYLVETAAAEKLKTSNPEFGDMNDFEGFDIPY